MITQDTGTVVRPDDRYEGYFVVRMDQPARYRQPDGRDEMLGEIVKHWDNLEILPQEQ